MAFYVAFCFKFAFGLDEVRDDAEVEANGELSSGSNDRTYGNGDRAYEGERSGRYKERFPILWGIFVSFG